MAARLSAQAAKGRHTCVTKSISFNECKLSSSDCEYGQCHNVVTIPSRLVVTSRPFMLASLTQAQRAYHVLAFMAYTTADRAFMCELMGSHAPDVINAGQSAFMFIRGRGFNSLLALHRVRRPYQEQYPVSGR